MTDATDKPDFYPFQEIDFTRDETYSIVDLPEFPIWHGSRATLVSYRAARMFNWFRLNPPKKNHAFYHETPGKWNVDKDSWTRNPHQRFYFTDPSHAERFKSALEEFSPAPLMTYYVGDHVERHETLRLAGIVGFSLVSPYELHVSSGYLTLWMWCLDNLKGRVFVETSTMIFTEEDDLVLFRMTWCGDDNENKPKLPFEMLGVPK